MLRNLYVEQYIVSHAVAYGYPLVFLTWISLIILGLTLQFHKSHHYALFGKELLLIYLLIGCNIWGAEVIKYTPFRVIDPYLIVWDEKIGISVDKLVLWVNVHPIFKAGLTSIYQSLGYMLLFIPIWMAWHRRYALLREFYAYILLSALIGYGFYYFYPSVAPATAFGTKGFLEDQYATGIKFYELHHYLPTTTSKGGMISFPSFHVIWAWLLVYLVRCWKGLFIVLSTWALLLTVSCVLLGWHYAVDVLGSAIVLFLTYGIDKVFTYEKGYTFRRQY